MSFRTRDENNRDARFSSVPELTGTGQGQAVQIMDDHRTPYSNFPSHYETTANPYNLFFVAADGNGDWSPGRNLLGSWSGSAWTFQNFNSTTSVSAPSEDGVELLNLPLFVGQRFWVYEQFYFSTMVRQQPGRTLNGSVNA